MKDGLFDQLLHSVNQAFDRGAGKDTLPFHEWVEKTGVILDGRPFSFRLHEYLMGPYQDGHPHQIAMKGA